MDTDLAHKRASQPHCCRLREMLRVSNSPIALLANLIIAGSVKCYGSRRQPYRASQPQYGRLCEMLRDSTSPITLQANHGVFGSVKCYGFPIRP